MNAEDIAVTRRAYAVADGKNLKGRYHSDFVSGYRCAVLGLSPRYPHRATAWLEGYDAAVEMEAVDD